GAIPRPTTGPLWWDSPTAAASSPGPDDPTDGGPATPADLPVAADVVVVGGGFTGLWTAYYLLREQPGREVLVLEAEHVGFGASGRNGGWVSALWPVGADTLDRRYGRTATLAQLAALRDTVDEVGLVDAAEGLGAGFVKGGALMVARTAAQEQRARVAAAHAAGWGEGTTWLDAAATRERMDVAGARGATFTPHCARVHPRRLVDGLAAAVRRLGGRIVEGARVVRTADRVVVLTSGQRISAGTVVVATEGWTGSLAGLARRVVPVYSLMVATEPIDDERWGRIGLAGREVFADHGHVVIYGQRTDDGRIAFGGRGAPYHWGSQIRPEFDQEPSVFDALRTTLRDLLPQLDGIRFTHAWGGPLGIARDWHPSLTWDPVSRTGRAGGYVGDGVAASNLAGRTLADLVLGRDTALTTLPWVGHRSPRWEPEPLRWLGVNAGLRLAQLADHEEATTGQPARLGAVLRLLTAH
ncbi:MAG TPA: FAD-dependent oxidoreductase, partial [Ornithinibacter sp.]|nr:FAD-dependent oxidoreductase [Ornithinibacter sp.]